jgi:hypothetical protein
MEGFKKLPKMQCFKTGGKVEAKAMCYGGKMKEGGKADIAQDKKIVKKAFAMHDKQEHAGEKTDLSKLKKGGRSKKEAGTVRKYKAGGDVTNVYEAKKKSGDKDNIKKVKQITPTKAASSSAALKGVGNTTAAFKKGGNVSEAGKKAGDKDATVKTKMGPSKADTKSAAMKKGGAVKKYAGDTDGSFVKGQGAVSEAERKTAQTATSDYDKNRQSNINKLSPSQQEEFAKQQAEATAKYGPKKKKGGKIKKFAEGGFTAEEEKWLGGADRTDPFILARMRSALGEQKPQGSYIPNANPAMDNRDVGMPQSSYIPNASPAMDNRDVGMAPARRPAPAVLPAGPSADDRLRMRNARPVQAANVEQDSGVAYPQGKPAPNMYANREPSAMQRFFSATPAEQAANFQRGVQARKNFGKTTPGSTPSFSSLLDALNKPKV